MNSLRKKTANEKGSVFLYILIAIFLFATLTYIISDNSRSNVSMVDKEQVKVAAQEIIEYGDVLTAAVQKLLLRGCDEDEISFEGMITSGTYINPNSPADESCHIFSNAGLVNYISPDSTNWLDKSRTGESNYGNSTVTGKLFITDVGSTDTELIIYTPYIKKEVCAEINNLLNIDIDLSVADTIGGGVSAFIGDYSPSGIPEIGDDNTNLSGQLSFCFLTSSGHFNNIKVLIAR